MTNRKGNEKFLSKLEVACTLAVIARNNPGYTVLQSRQKMVVKLFVSFTMCLSQLLCLSLSLFSLRLRPPPPPSLSLSLSVALTLPVALFVCDSGDSRSLMPYFALAVSLYLSEACSLSISLSRKLVLSLTLSLCMSLSDSLSLSLCNYCFPCLDEMGSTRHASTPLLATQPYLPSFACQTLSGESRQRDWYYLSAKMID